MDAISMDSLLAKLQAAREAVRTPLSATDEVPGKSEVTAKSAAGSPKAVDFAALLKTSVDSVDRMQTSAGALADKFQMGDPKVTLEDTMIALQKANISFQAMIQIRNKAVAAYHDIMNLQI